MTGNMVAAAGVVLWREGPHGPEVAVVHRPKYDDWSFPKGKLDPGENWPDAALRETLEETGITVTLGALLGDTRYIDRKGRPKVVRYWAATALRGGFAPNEEVDELRWLPPAEARSLLSYDRDQALLDALLLTRSP